MNLLFQPVDYRIPGGTLDPTSVPKYQTPLLIPPVMPKAGTVKVMGGKQVDYYEISMRQFEQQILPAGLPKTTVWGPALWTPKMWMEPITENPGVGAVEEWEFYNGTADAHPMHIHEVLFQVVNRQDIFVDEVNHEFQVAPGSSVLPPEPWENGWKDTVLSYPGQVTRVKAQFANPGQFVWHCHIVEHEDNEMMRPYRVGPVQPGEPGHTMP